MPAPAATAAAPTTDDLTPETWVAAVIRSRIADGTYPPGSKLPPQRHLGDELDVSSKIMTEGFGILAAEGLVEARKLVGTVVTGELPAHLAPAPPRPANLSPRRRKVEELTEDQAVEFAAALRATRKLTKQTQGQVAKDAGVAKTMLAELEKAYLRRPAESDMTKLRAWIQKVTAEAAPVAEPVEPEPEHAVETDEVAELPKAEPAPEPEPVAPVVAGGPGTYFLYYSYLDEDDYTQHANAVVPLPAEPTTLAHVRSIEATITAGMGHEGVVLASWRRMATQA